MIFLFDEVNLTLKNSQVEKERNCIQPNANSLDKTLKWREVIETGGRALCCSYNLQQEETIFEICCITSSLLNAQTYSSWMGEKFSEVSS